MTIETTSGKDIPRLLLKPLDSAISIDLNNRNGRILGLAFPADLEQMSVLAHVSEAIKAKNYEKVIQIFELNEGIQQERICKIIIETMFERGSFLTPHYFHQDFIAVALRQKPELMTSLIQFAVKNTSQGFIANPNNTSEILLTDLKGNIVSYNPHNPRWDQVQTYTLLTGSNAGDIVNNEGINILPSVPAVYH